MAVSEIHPIKVNLRQAINYYMNPAKTDNGRLVTGINCTPDISYEEFIAVKNHFGKSGGTLAHVFRQSFKPGEITPDLAHEIGIKLAQEFSGEKYQTVVCSHIDKDHIHSHIFFNSVSFIDGTKYHEYNNYKRLKSINDRLCQEYGLSTIENPKEKGKSYKEWMEDKKGTSWKTQIRNDIDRVISKSQDFEDYISKLRAEGYNVKRGKYTSYRPPGKERFARGKTLGVGYTDDSIKAKIIINQLGGRYLFSREGEKPKKQKYLFSSNSQYPFRKKESITDLLLSNFLLAITILKTISGDLKSPVYKNIKRPEIKPHEKKVVNDRIKMLADQLFVIQKEQIHSKKDLNQRINNAKENLQETREKLINCEKNLNRMKTIYEALENYHKYKPIAMKFRKSIQRKKYEDKYDTELRLYEFAEKQVMDFGLNSQDRVDDFIDSYNKQQKIYELLKRDYNQAKIKVTALHELQDAANDLFEIKYMLRKEDPQQTPDSNQKESEPKKKGR